MSSQASYDIAVLAGDGIGPEVMTAAIDVLSAVSEKFNFSLSLNHHAIGGAAIDQFGKALPDTTLVCVVSKQMQFYLAQWADQNGKGYRQQSNQSVHRLLPLRKHFGLFCNLRPAQLLPALSAASPLRADISSKGFDILCVRELTGGIYFGDKGRSGEGAEEYAFDTQTYSRKENRTHRSALHLKRQNYALIK